LKGHVGIQYLRNSMRSTRNMRAEAKRRGDTRDVKRYTKELDSLSKSFLSEVNRVKGRKKGKV